MLLSRVELPELREVLFLLKNIVLTSFVGYRITIHCL